MKSNFPSLSQPSICNSNKRTLFISAYGFEERVLGWLKFQDLNKGKISFALMFKYSPPKGQNQIEPAKKVLKKIGINNKNVLKELNYLVDRPDQIETELLNFINENFFDEIIVDITPMTKYLILVCLATLKTFRGGIKIVYTEGLKYSPTIEEYNESKDDMKFLAKYPSQGVNSLIRANCLTSIRMQGQPTVLIAFTSFNEQLVRHLLGSLNPHRIIFINGRPPRKENGWREVATQEIHSKLIKDYSFDNPLNEDNLLVNSTSTLNYIESILLLDKIYRKFGNYERIVCGATGSKMQTVGLLIAKLIHPDIHIEYPTPDSYYSPGLSIGIRQIHEINISNFEAFIVGQRAFFENDIIESKQII